MSQIDPKKFYNLTELLPFIPWIRSLPTLAKWVEADRKNENKLKAIINGNASGKRYFILGENIINYLANVEDQGLKQSSLEGGE